MAKFDVLRKDRYVLRDVDLNTLKLYFALKYLEDEEHYKKFKQINDFEIRVRDEGMEMVFKGIGISEIIWSEGKEGEIKMKTEKEFSQFQNYLVVGIVSFIVGFISAMLLGW